MKKTLPKELTQLVDWSVTVLGRVIKSERGVRAFRQIEKIRRYVKSPAGSTSQGLFRLKKELEALSGEDRFAVAHSFALMLELINSCETAYRTYRLKQEFAEREEESKSYGRVIHVLTAHPTESRNPDIIHYFKKIQNLLERRLEKARPADAEELHVLLNWAWHIPMSKQRKPSVMDEAEYIYSLSLQESLIEYYVEQYRKKRPFYIRTWVGGDKDGHPGVTEKSLVGSLQMSRQSLLAWLKAQHELYLEDLLPLEKAIEARKEVRALLQASKNFRKDLMRIRRLKAGDAKVVAAVQNNLDRLAAQYQNVFTSPSPVLEKMRTLFQVFPAMVVPLEIREAAELVHDALKQSSRPSTISRMLKKLQALTGGGDPRFYVRGFILSQTESADDMRAGVRLVERYFKQVRLPVVPLFESAHALENSVDIINDFLKNSSQRQKTKKFWSSKLEVMVGYSDSAKENGALPSRYLIYTAVEKLDRAISSYGFQPIFFHGSGGSIERGGGSVQEQTEWWPLSALQTVKVTVQGEMIYRSYAAPEVLRRQVGRFGEARDRAGKTPRRLRHRQELQEMADAVQRSYREMLADPHFLELIELATPYSFMKDLRLGSRPAKRQGSVQIKNLRAIPWVLCWTQTRSLFPTWWGVGTFWKSLKKRDKAQYRALFKESSLFRSYIKALGFTLKKIEMPVFGFYLQSSKLPPEVAASFLRRFEAELSECKKAVREISGEGSLIWYRPWLETSIELRSPLIHPLNVLQLTALESKDIPLLRETVTGIASGMLTTG